MAGPSPLESMDDKRYFEMIQKMFELLENAYLKNDDNKHRTKLMEDLRKHIKLGGKIAYNVLPNQYSSQIMTALEEQKIPYANFPDANGNMMFIVKETDSEKFLDIQKTFTQISTDYAKELTPQNVLNLYQKHNIKNVDTLTFNNKEMAAVAEKKLYGAGVTFAKVEENGTTTMILSPFSKYSSDGNDISNFELLHAFEQSKADPLIKDKADLIGLRFKQATWDAEQMTKFATHVKNGDNYVFAPLHGNVSSYIECSNLGVNLVEKSSSAEGGWKTTPILISKDASVRDIEIVLSKAASNIMNAAPVPASKFDRDKNPTRNDLLEKNPDILRPEGQQMEAKLEKIGNQDIKPMLEAINAEATKYVNSLYTTEYITQETAYQKKKEFIANILNKRELPEIQKFLNSNAGGFSVKEREQWYSNIEKHFLDTQEKENQYECCVGKENVKSLTNKLAKILGVEVEKPKSKEAEPEYDDD